MGNFVYSDHELEFIQTTEGRVLPDAELKDIYNYEYFLKDHLGNNRVVFDEAGRTLQNDSYYPFGMRMAGMFPNTTLTLPNKYLYNGKELQDDFGLDWYDYGARFYDVQIGRWHVVDPMAEEREWLSPYNYVQNNPILRIDPNGALDDGYKDAYGNYKWFDDETAKFVPKDDNLWVKFTDDKNIFNLAAAGILDDLPELRDPGEINPSILNIFGQAEEYINSPSIMPDEGVGKFALGILYGVADDIMVWGSNLILGLSKARHLNNSGANRSEITNSGLNTITTFVPVGSFSKGIGIGKQTVNASKFGTLFKGESVLKGAHKLRGLNIRKYNQTISTNNSFNSIFPYFNYYPLLLNTSTDTNQNK